MLLWNYSFQFVKVVDTGNGCCLVSTTTCCTAQPDIVAPDNQQITTPLHRSLTSPNLGGAKETDWEFEKVHRCAVCKDEPKSRTYKKQNEPGPKPGNTNSGFIFSELHDSHHTIRGIASKRGHITDPSEFSSFHSTTLPAFWSCYVAAQLLHLFLHSPTQAKW